jgi:hypothetical protein
MDTVGEFVRVVCNRGFPCKRTVFPAPGIGHSAHESPGFLSVPGESGAFVCADPGESEERACPTYDPTRTTRDEDIFLRTLTVR